MDKSVNASPKYKDALFILGRKEFALYLYNAISHSHYTDAEDLQIVTIKQYLYYKLKNDSAILFQSNMYLTEQQSTWNPNMPYRDLEYVVEEYQKYVADKGFSRYAYSMFHPPAPHFVVLYNGSEERPEKETLRLSDMYMDGEKGDLELIVHVYNINGPYNVQLKKDCRPLYEYCWLVERIRAGMEPAEDKRDTELLGRVITEALDEMPEDFLIKGILMKERNAVIGMIFDEYNEALDRKAAEDYAKEQHQEGLDEGIEIGEERGERRNAIQTAINLLKKLPGWTDEQIAELVQPLSATEIAQLRKGAKLI